MLPIYVFGHKNPDNDSIASAIAYAYLKNHVDPDNEYIPARLGPMPKESSWVCETYNVPVPMAIPHVHNRVRDVMTSPVISVPYDTTMLVAGRTLKSRGVRALVVNGPDGRYIGLITSRILAELYVDETDLVGFDEAPVTLGNLAACFEGTIVVGEPSRVMHGRLLIGAGEPETVAAAIAPGDTIILGDRRRTQPIALEAGAGCIVLSCGATADQKIIELARSKGAALITTRFDTYAVARFGTLSHTVQSAVETDVVTFKPDDLLSEAAEDLLASPHREGVVLDDDGRCVGIVTRSDIARSTKRRVVLVDHNESSQSAPGILEADVVEIVDHHRVADIQTAAPIRFLNLPLGSTATIVTQEYGTLGVAVPEDMAAVLLSAIMTDTVMLKSPTTTPTDHVMARRLGKIIGRDPLEFGMEVFRSRGGDQTATVEDIIGADAKEFLFGDHSVLIAQHETVDLETIMKREQEITAGMEEKLEAKGYDMFLLMVTDLVKEGSQFICVGNPRTVERAFGISFDQGSVWIPGILSRKKQVVGRLIEHSA